MIIYGFFSYFIQSLLVYAHKRTKKKLIILKCATKRNDVRSKSIESDLLYFVFFYFKLILLLFSRVNILYFFCIAVCYFIAFCPCNSVSICFHVIILCTHTIKVCDWRTILLYHFIHFKLAL